MFTLLIVRCKGHLSFTITKGMSAIKARAIFYQFNKQKHREAIIEASNKLLEFVAT